MTVIRIKKMKNPKLFQTFALGAAVAILMVFNRPAMAQDYWGYSTGDPQPDTVITSDTSAVDTTAAYDSTGDDNSVYTINNYYYSNYYGDYGFDPSAPQLFVGYDYYGYSAPWYYGGWYPVYPAYGYTGWGHYGWRNHGWDHDGYGWGNNWNGGWNNPYDGGGYYGDNGSGYTYGGYNNGGYYGGNGGSGSANHVRTIGATRGVGNPNGNIVTVPQHATPAQNNS